MRRPLVLMLPLLLLAAAPAAQDGGSPTIAPPVTGAVMHGQSPLLNWPNGIWDQGEGFPSPDQGGVISPSNPALLQLSDINILVPWGPMPPPNNMYWRVIAEIRPPQVPAGQVLAESTFEIVVPAVLATVAADPAKYGNIVMLLSAEQTSFAVRPQDRPYDPHDYSGDPGNYGTRPWPFPGFGLVDEYANKSVPDAPFYLVAGQIVTRTSFQPLVFSAQRLRELRRAMMLMITAQFYTGATPPRPQPDFSTCVGGTSFGASPR